MRADFFQFLFEMRNPFANGALVHFQLCLAGTAQTHAACRTGAPTASACLTFKVCPLTGEARQVIFILCQFHLQQNAASYVPRQELKAPVAADLRAVFNAPDRREAERLLAAMVEKYRDTAPRLAAWLESDVPEGLTVFAWPAAWRKRLRTTNVLERLNEEIRRRTRVALLFPNEAALLRLASAVLIEISEDWETGKIYLAKETD